MKTPILGTDRLILYPFNEGYVMEVFELGQSEKQDTCSVGGVK